MTPLSTPAAQGTVSVLNAADRMREFMEGSRLGFAIVPVAHLAEWRKLLSERYQAEVERVNRATDAEIGGIHRSFAPSPEALPASGVEEALRKSLTEVLAFARALEKQSGKGTGGRRGGAIFARAEAALTSAPAPEDRTREAAAIKLADGYGIVLAMIAAGCSDPQRFAKRMLAEYEPEAKRLEITK